MPLAAGVRLGPYEITAAIGAGGMGEVYRARDTRLQRDVAIKSSSCCLFSAPGSSPPLRAGSPRGRGAESSEHPRRPRHRHIGRRSVHRLGAARRTDAARAAGRRPDPRAQGAGLCDRNRAGTDRGARTSHRPPRSEAGESVHHRRRSHQDPRLRAGETGRRWPGRRPASELQTAPPPTEIGTVLGTVGYMAPEQVRGLPVDHRADLFAFGAILYELVSGQRAFRRHTAPETMTAILNEDPPPLPSDRAIPTSARTHRRSMPREESRGAVSDGERSRVRAGQRVGRVGIPEWR